MRTYTDTTTPIISIHAPRGGSDLPNGNSTSGPFYFNPRSPRGERRKIWGMGNVTVNHFNPRSPRGERLIKIKKGKDKKEFQSTLPAGGATAAD